MGAVTTRFAQSNELSSSLFPWPDGDVLQEAKRLVRFNNALATGFGDGLFEHPVLMMMLELIDAKLGNRATTVKALTANSGVPQSTAGRWIDRMEARGLVTKKASKCDRRSALVELDDRAFNTLRRLLTR